MNQFDEMFGDPRNGWVYIDPTTLERFQGKTFQLLLRAVKGSGREFDFNKVREQLCANNPGFCKGDWRKTDIELTEVVTGIETLSAWAEAGAVPVPEAEAEKRASICAKCPNNIPIRGCWKCAEVAARVITLTKGLTTTNDHNLRGCNACHCINRLAVHVPQQIILDNLPDKVYNVLPDFCWKKTKL